MRILISNDDGIEAPGINALRLKLEELSFVEEIYILAPEKERSAVGHGITMHKPLRAKEVFYDCPKSKGFSVNGTPADCVKLGLEEILTTPPDLVLSGINKGSNLGTDILYSGTVSAALEGAIHKIPSMAISHTSFSSEDFGEASSFMAKFIEFIYQNNWQWKKGNLLNINIPPGKPLGIKTTCLANRVYINTFDRRVDPRGNNYYWMIGEPIELDEPGSDTDVNTCKDGYIAITPIQIDLTDYEQLDLIKELEDLIKRP